ncbi:MAG: TetR/AcrR family transcriptional regulator [Chitinophagaceae bacterium]|nr:TetR/AcrR family transcriptional regulator [Chitinophagaceae bacterium]
MLVLIKHLFNFAPELFNMSYSEKQLQIIETAEKLFAIKGFDGTSVRDIADEAGVNLAMINYYFGSKEKLMQALFEQRTGHVKMQVDNLMSDDSLAPMQKVEKLIDNFVDRVIEREKFYKIMTCEQMMHKNDSPITELMIQMKKRNAEAVSQLLKDGQKKGVFKKNVDVLFLMMTMVGTLTQMIISKPFYKEYNNLQSLPEEKFNQQFRKKISDHIKLLFKAILIHEA